LFSLRIREGGRCECCGETMHLQCAHVFSRRYLSTRWDFQNAMCLCRGCHVRYTHRPLEWEQFVIGKIGAGVYASLKRKALEICKPDYDEIIKQLEAA